MEDMLLFFEKYREECFTKSMDLAKTVAFEMNVEPIFPTKHRVIIKKKLERTMNTMNISHQRNHLKSSIFYCC
jgi:hypothetical protein